MTQAFEQLLALSATQQKGYVDYDNLIQAAVAQQKKLAQINEEMGDICRKVFNRESLLGKNYIYTRPRKWNEIPETPNTLEAVGNFFNNRNEIPEHFKHFQVVDNQTMQQTIKDYFPDFAFENNFYKKEKYLVLGSFEEDDEESLIDDPRKTLYELMVIAI